MPKPFLRWAGGKSQLLPDLTQLIPQRFNVYHEPFIGGGALFFNLNPELAYINDYNIHLSELYSDLQQNVEELILELTELENDYLKLEHEARKAFFYEKRSVYNILGSSFFKSALLMFLNRTCFNGIYRENPNGDFNVPFGKNNIKLLFDPAQLRDVSKALQGVKITSGSYAKAIASAEKGDFIYLDPPYVPLNNTSSFTAYTGKGFGLHEQEELRDNLIKLTDRGCYVMLSNSNSSEVKSLYKNFNIYEVQANRSVNCKATGRGKITELIITNYKI